jgi:hypothetical protein
VGVLEIFIKFMLVSYYQFGHHLVEAATYPKEISPRLFDSHLSRGSFQLQQLLSGALDHVVMI